MWSLTIGQCEDREDFEKLISEHSDYYDDWHSYIAELLIEKGLSYKDVAAGCDISESTAKRIFRSVPSKRDNVIKLAAMLSLSVEETDMLLTRRAKYQKLYAKNAEDAIWMFILNNGGSRFPEKEFNELHSAFIRMCELQPASPEDDAKKDVSTLMVSDELLAVTDKKEFIAAMYSLIPAFEQGYKKLAAYIEGLFESKGASANTLFEDNPNFRKLHYTQMDRLKRHECPTRTYLLTLGIHLGLNVDGINELLQTAGMGEICSKDRLESAIFFFLEELYCNNPEAFFDPAASDGSFVYSDLANGFVCMSAAVAGFDVDEDTLADYIRIRLEELKVPLDSRIRLSRIMELL